MVILMIVNAINEFYVSAVISYECNITDEFKDKNDIYISKMLWMLIVSIEKRIILNIHFIADHLSNAYFEDIMKNIAWIKDYFVREILQSLNMTIALKNILQFLFVLVLEQISC